MKKIFLSILFAILIATGFAQIKKDIAYYTKMAPFPMPSVAQPKFADKTFSITDYAAVNDGKTLNTAAFAKAIDVCNKAGGGKVVVPAGNWLTGPIELKSNVNLHLEKDAMILFTKDHSQYPMIKVGGSTNGVAPASPIYAYNASNIAITGEGVIDGAGESWRPVKKQKQTPAQWNALIASGGVLSADGKIWWPTKEAMNGEIYLQQLKNKTADVNDYLPARDFLRPYMVYLIHCDTILIEGVTIRNSPKFIFYPNHCNHLTLNSAFFYNDWWAQNGDALDISACKNVVIFNCNVNAGDDGICMKSSGSKGIDNFELENILIAGCTVLRAHGGFVIGSNTDGGMRNIYVADCNFVGTDIGIRVKSNPGRGGLVKDIYINNISMSSIKNEAILFSSYYEDVPAGKNAVDVKTTASDKIPMFQDFHLSNIVCKGAETAISIVGLPEMPVSKIYFQNIDITADHGFESTDATDIDIRSIKLQTAKPLYKLKNSKNIMVDGKPAE
ncbi:MAG: glycoside hydrolase family 28 protein [Ferruginibacter sp.]